jgi:cytochrome c oxidase assembly protein subunit 15
MVVAWMTESRRWVRWLCTAVLGMVIFQGVLGGLRVVLVKLDLAIVHACVAQAFFCLATLAAIVTSRWWLADGLSTFPQGRKLIRLAIVTVCMIYAQLIIGAMMRHYQAGLAIPDLPLAYGKLLPPMNQTDLDAANHMRAWNLNLPPVTLSQIWLHFGHRIGAILVTIHVCLLVSVILRRHRRSDLLIPAGILAGLLVVQITLGVLTVYFCKPADVASAHVAVGALVLVTTFLIAVRAMRLYSRPIAAGAISPIISAGQNRLAVAGSSHEDRY